LEVEAAESAHNYHVFKHQMEETRARVTDLRERLGDVKETLKEAGIDSEKLLVQAAIPPVCTMSGFNNSLI